MTTRHGAGGSTTVAPRGASIATVAAAAMMLFSMFFGAGNLIFPPVLGAEAGPGFLPALAGFLLGGVILPVATIAAVAISGADVQAIAARAGVVFGIAFPVVVYLSIGAFYGLPRVGAVSFATAVAPVTGWDSVAASVAFNAVFFTVALALAYDPSSLIDSLGRVLTPLLLVLLAVLVSLCLATFTADAAPATAEYATAPVTAGLLAGYMTMDSVAALAFGIVVIGSLRARGLGEGPALVRGTMVAAVLAGSLLAVIYLGLGLVGRVVPGQHADGAAMLSEAALLTMGPVGQVGFGAIVLLACLTTAVGLLAASGQFFARLVPGTSYRVWLLVFALVAFVVASTGLETVLDIAAPIIGFVYPVVITVVALTLLTPLLRAATDLRWGFRLPAWTATVWSALTLALSLGWGAALIEPLIGWSPGAAAGLGWVLPVVLALLVGLGLDLWSARDGHRRGVAAHA